MKIRRSIAIDHHCGVIFNHHDIVDLTDFEEGDSVRIGFTKGTLKKAIFELHSSTTITYEKVDE